jgi:hypothetical protein
MEPYFIVRDTTKKEIVIFPKHIISLTEGVHGGTLVDMINGASIYVPITQDQIIKLIDDSYKDKPGEG